MAFHNSTVLEAAAADNPLESTPLSTFPDVENNGITHNEVVGSASHQRDHESSSRTTLQDSALDVGVSRSPSQAFDQSLITTNFLITANLDHEEISSSQTDHATPSSPSVLSSTEGEDCDYTVVTLLPLPRSLSLIFRREGFTQQDADELWPRCPLCSRRFSVYLEDPPGHQCPETSADHSEPSPLAQHSALHVLLSHQGCDNGDFGALLVPCDRCDRINIKGFEEVHQCSHGVYDLIAG